MQLKKTYSVLFVFIFASVFLCAQTAFADFPLPWQINFQKPASPIMEELYWFHNFLVVICTSIVVFVFALLVYVVVRFRAAKNPVPDTFSHNITIEIIWTVIPVIILAIIAVPSFRILKLAEHSPPAEMTVKVIGAQWYWTYNYPDHGGFEYDSYMIEDKDLKPGQLRLLEVDNRVVIPQNTVVKFLITASDVIHSFAVPALGIKTDAVPGRTNETWTKVADKGVYYGQCSELCGVKHGFMPIAVEVVSHEEFENWVRSKGGKIKAEAEAKIESTKDEAEVGGPDGNDLGDDEANAYGKEAGQGEK